MARPAGGEDLTPRRRVVVMRFAGTQASHVHAAVVSGLRRQAIVVDEDQFAEVLSSAEGPTRPDRIAAACREMGVDAAVEGSMRRVGRAWGVEVFVRDCANGEKILPSGRANYSLRNLGGVSAIRGTIWSRLGAAIVSATGTSGGGSARVASAAPDRPAPSRATRPAPARPAPTRPTPARSTPAPPSRPSASSADGPCIFNEDEPPEGFPGYGDWVRRRNAYLNRCEEAKRQRAADAVRRRQEAERRARAEAADRARRAAEEEQRRRAEAERARRAEEARARREAEDRRRAIEDARRREEEARLAERRRREEEARLAERRRREDEERTAAARRRRYDEETSSRSRYDDDPPPRDRRRDDRDIEREVAAYRARLERERLAALDRPDYDDRRRRFDEEDPPASMDDGDRRFRDSDEGRDRPSRDEDEDRYRDEDRDPVYDTDDSDWNDSEDEPDRDRDRDREDYGDRHAADEELRDDPERPGDDHPAATRRVALAPTVLHLGAGIGFANRQMTVEVEGSAKPRSYSAPGYPELAVEARFFPAALTKNPGVIGGLGAYGLFRRHLFLQTSGLDATSGQPVSIPTGEQELAGGVIFRTPMGSGAKSPIFEISIGYGYFQFLLGPTEMSQLDESMQMPTMTYVNVIGNAGVAIPLDDRGLAVELGGTYRYVLDVGQAARDLFGAKTKGGYALGGRASLGGEASFIANGLFWSLVAEALVFNTEFSGVSSYGGGAIGGFPSGSDRYLRGTAVVGYRFR